MLQYLENSYLQKIYLENKFIDRKIELSSDSYTIKGITKVGKTMLVKNYLLEQSQNRYLYLDCSDCRINQDELSINLNNFCKEKKIEILVLDNYNLNIQLPDVNQIIILSEMHFHQERLKSLEILPLDYEEYLAYEQKFDSTALNNYFKLGGLPVIHSLTPDIHARFFQKSFQSTLNLIEFKILLICSKFYTTKISIFNIYEKLKREQKISKDKVYLNYQALIKKSYIYQLEKFTHSRATNKIYLSDIAIQTSLTLQKNFSKVFENFVYLHLKRKYRDIYYYDNIDFYMPSKNMIVFSYAFIDERSFFKKLEQIEAFIFQYRVEQIVCITLNNETALVHPFSQVNMIPFSIWALSEE